MTGEQQELFPQVDADKRTGLDIQALDSVMPMREPVLGAIKAINYTRAKAGVPLLNTNPGGVSDEVPAVDSVDEIMVDIIERQMEEVYTVDMSLLAELDFDTELVRKLIDPERVERFGAALYSEEMFAPYLSAIFRIPVEDIRWLIEDYQLFELACDKYEDVDYRPSTLLFLFFYCELRLEGKEQASRPGIVTLFAGRIEQMVMQMAA